MPSVGVALTVHNRRENTVGALRELLERQTRILAGLRVFLMDDGSTDGTSEAVRAAYPEATILRGSGDLFWNGGMRSAFGEALRLGFDYYLWLNDDTLMDSDALERLLDTSSMVGGRSIVVGSIRDDVTGAHTYGGVRRCSRWHPLKFALAPPAAVPVPADTMNGNCVLIPSTVAESVGNLDSSFTHGMGDLDYGLRACRLGFEVQVAPGFVGTCSRNSDRGTWLDPALPLAERWRKARSPKGLPPREWLIFARRHGGCRAYLVWLMPYLRMCALSFQRRAS